MKKLINYIVLFIVGFVFGGFTVAINECYDDEYKDIADRIVYNVFD